MPPTPVRAPSELSRLFTPPTIITSTVVPRLCISLEALDKCGKTHWSLFTPPDPICLVTNDTGTPHVLDKAIKAGRRIPHVMQLNYKSPDPAVTKTSEVDKTEWDEWKKAWRRFKAGIKALEDDETIRTLVWDTATEIWNLCMLSHFGKLQKISQNLRTECNGDYSKVFFDLYKSRPDLNMILIHKLKKEYKPNTKGDSDWTGKYESSGFNQTGFQVDLTLRADWDGVRKCLYTELNKPCRFGFDQVGKRWYGEESGFGWLGMEIFPETMSTPEIWGLG